jgi:protein-S-isoprenylcysteine O-methyltransferase Ste14
MIGDWVWTTLHRVDNWSTKKMYVMMAIGPWPIYFIATIIGTAIRGTRDWGTSFIGAFLGSTVLMFIGSVIVGCIALFNHYMDRAIKREERKLEAKP